MIIVAFIGLLETLVKEVSSTNLAIMSNKFIFECTKGRELTIPSMFSREHMLYDFFHRLDRRFRNALHVIQSSLLSVCKCFSTMLISLLQFGSIWITFNISRNVSFESRRNLKVMHLMRIYSFFQQKLFFCCTIHLLIMYFRFMTNCRDDRVIIHTFLFALNRRDRYLFCWRQ